MKKKGTRGGNRRKISKSPKPRPKVVLTARSVVTGITHVFDDIAEAQRLTNQLKKARASKLETDLINSFAFWAWINGLDSIASEPDLTWNRPVYRLTAGWSALSIVGSIADGGRFNIGGAQLCPEFSDVKKAGALYTASTLECCYHEISGNPIGKLDEYELIPTRIYKLWDLAKVIVELNRPGLDDLVKAAPFEAIWAYQKVPLIPQLLAHRLRGIGGDGLIYPSTKNSSAMNICFFFRTDDESRAGFTERKLS